MHVVHSLFFLVLLFFSLFFCICRCMCVYLCLRVHIYSRETIWSGRPVLGKSYVLPHTYGVLLVKLTNFCLKSYFKIPSCFPLYGILFEISIASRSFHKYPSALQAVIYFMNLTTQPASEQKEGFSCRKANHVCLNRPSFCFKGTASWLIPNSFCAVT